MNSEIRVALAVPLLGIGEAGMPNRQSVESFLLAERQRAKRLGEHVGSVDANSHLARSRPEQSAAYPHDIPDVEQLQRRVDVVTHQIFAKVELNAAGLVREVREGCLAVRA